MKLKALPTQKVQTTSIAKNLPRNAKGGSMIASAEKH